MTRSFQRSGSAEWDESTLYLSDADFELVGGWFLAAEDWYRTHRLLIQDGKSEVEPAEVGKLKGVQPHFKRKQGRLGLAIWVVRTDGGKLHFNGTARCGFKRSPGAEWEESTVSFSDNDLFDFGDLLNATAAEVKNRARNLGA